MIDLRLFLAVVDAGSITRGAATVGLSLSAASARLRDMETAGGVKLLERGQRGVSPTDAGETIVHHARLIERQTIQMRSELGEHAKGMRTIVRLMANTAAVTEFLPTRLASWMQAHPQIDVELNERQSSQIVKSISNGAAEIGIISDTVTIDGLYLRPFAIDRLVLVTPPNHPLAAEKALHFADILHEDLVGLAEGALQDNLDGRALTAGGQFKTRIRTRTFEGICQMVAGGVGLGIVPEATVLRCRRFMKISYLRLADDWATRQLSVCIRSQEALTPSARALADHLANYDNQRRLRQPR